MLFWTFLGLLHSGLQPLRIITSLYSCAHLYVSLVLNTVFSLAYYIWFFLYTFVICHSCTLILYIQQRMFAYFLSSFFQLLGIQCSYLTTMYHCVLCLSIIVCFLLWERNFLLSAIVVTFYFLQPVPTLATKLFEHPLLLPVRSLW